MNPKTGQRLKADLDTLDQYVKKSSGDLSFIAETAVI
jgi:hypothetical protein